MLRLLTPDEVIMLGLDKAHWEPVSNNQNEPMTDDYNLKVYDAVQRYLRGEFK